MKRFDLGSIVMASCALLCGAWPAQAAVQGDFNGDGFADLAVGAPGEDLATALDVGAVNIIYGSASGLASAGNQLWSQDSPGILERAEAGDLFGSALATGDFDGDGFSDLAVGVPSEDSGVTDAGGVNILYGSPSGLTAAGNEFLNQDSPGIVERAEAGDRFGSALATRDFDGDGFDDLVIGVPFEDSGVTDVGGINVLYGSPSGLIAAGNQFWNQDSPGVTEVAEAGDLFGSALVTRDFDGDGFDDLAVGVPSEDRGSVSDAGAVNILYGSASGLTSTGNQLWNQDTAGIIDALEAGDTFGSALAARDFNGDGFDDLAVGVPHENIGSLSDAGAVNILYGSASGLTSAGNQFWNQDSSGISGDAEAGDTFGWALAARDFNGDGFDDLAVGIPHENVGSVMDAGSVSILYGSALGVTSAGNEVWNQNSTGITDSAEAGDLFGSALAAGDFGFDGFADLAIGVPSENVGSVSDAGAVSVLYGSTTGLATAGNQIWNQDSSGIAERAEAGDFFGSALVSRD